jgi:hypothetical protein
LRSVITEAEAEAEGEHFFVISHDPKQRRLIRHRDP